MNSLAEMSDECLSDYLSVINKLMGITISKTKKIMICGRVRKRIVSLSLSSYDEYLAKVKNCKIEEEQFVNAITTNETYFYRTPRIWNYVEKVFLPDFLKHKKDVRIWSAASSTGEEAYTLGVLCEQTKKQNSNLHYEILGTDINSSVVEKASTGLYRGRSVKRFQDTRPLLFNSYMKGTENDGYQVIPEIKRSINFKTHNLFEEFKRKEQFDLILLRNVLIYFQKTDQEIVLDNVYKALKKDGILIIGESESLSQLDTQFESVSPLIYKRKIDKKVSE